MRNDRSSWRQFELCRRKPNASEVADKISTFSYKDETVRLAAITGFVGKKLPSGVAALASPAPSSIQTRKVAGWPGWSFRKRRSSPAARHRRRLGAGEDVTEGEVELLASNDYLSDEEKDRTFVGLLKASVGRPSRASIRRSIHLVDEEPLAGRAHARSSGACCRNTRNSSRSAGQERASGVLMRTGESPACLAADRSDAAGPPRASRRAICPPSSRWPLASASGFRASSWS